MPVINLPQDTRWGDLGKGIGGLVGQVLGAVGQQQVQQGVSQLTQDTSIAPDKLPSEIFKKFGTEGIKNYAQIITLQEGQATLRDTLAQVKGRELTNQLHEQIMSGGGGGSGAASIIDTMSNMSGVKLSPEQRTNLESVYKVALLQGKDPNAEVERFFKLNMEGQLQPLKKQELEGNIAMQPAKLAEAQGGAAAAPFKGPQAAANLQRTTQQTAAEAPVAVTPESIQQAFPTLSTEQAQAAALAASTTGKKGLATEVGKQVQSTQVQPTRVQDADLMAKSSEYAATMKNFTENLLKSPESGLFTGATIKAWGQRHGITFGEADVPLLNMMESQAQAVAQQAKAGGSMMMSTHSIALAKDITDNIGRTPLANIVATNLIADQQIKIAQQRALALKNTRQSTAVHDQAIKDWEEVKNITGSLDSYVTKDGHTVVMFQGNEINPSNLTSRFKGGGANYKVGQSQVDGATVMENARIAGVTPEQWLAAAQAHVGQ